MAKTDETKNADAQAEKASSEVQSVVDDAEAKGYLGTVPDPIPNEEYSLKTGPDSPPLVPDNQTRFAQSTTKDGK